MSSNNPTGQGAPPPALPRPIGKLFLDPRFDGVDFTFQQTLVQNLSSAAPNGNSNLVIDTSFDFYWVAASHQVDIAGAAQQESTVPIPLVTVIINDTGSGRQLSNGPVPLGCISGPGERPYRLLLPRLIRGGSTVSFTWASYVAAGTTYTNLYYILHGFRLPAGSPYNI